ncbi:MAG: hypothetical protein HY652_04755 [Acidobacteria bacterium]|nr:hypothetical protein [Acidobacteriota bacterium]
MQNWVGSRRKFLDLSGRSILGALTLPYFAPQLGSPVHGQGFAYPAPRDPDLKALLPKVGNVDDLLPMARQLVSVPPRKWAVLPSYGIESGQKALLIVDSSFDRMVLDAITRALREKGILADQLVRDARAGQYGGRAFDTAPPPPEWQITNWAAGRTPEDSMRPWFSDFAIQQGYRLVVEGMGGPVATQKEFSHERFYNQWTSAERFAFFAGYPYKLREMIEFKTMEILWKTTRVRITDPEGTDISYSLYPELWSLLQERELRPKIYGGHEWGYPQMVVLDKSDAEGVIAGTISHVAPFPRILVRLKQHQVVEVEGGGAYGDAWRDLLQQYKNVHWPNYPRPGYSYLIEAAIGTDPWALPGTWWTAAIRRSGVLHFGFGVDSRAKSFIDFVKSKKVMGGHAPHIHAYFPTFQAQTSDGKTVKVIDKGRLTVLDHPEVRAEAAKYGDPDKLLTELWIPAMPGINFQGDYQKDYAADPARWIRQWNLRLEGKA